MLEEAAAGGAGGGEEDGEDTVGGEAQSTEASMHTVTQGR
jgi:hypothetical protein